MKNNLLLSVWCIFLLSLFSCTTSHVKCPTFSSRKTHSGVHYTAHNYKHPKNHKQASEPVQAAAKPQEESGISGLALGGIGGGTNELNFKLPKLFTKNLQSGEIKAANEVFKGKSENRVTLVKKGNKVYLKAKSVADVPALMKKMASTPPEGNGGGGVAIAAGVLGIIGFLLAFGPYVSFFAIACAIAAVILGIIGLGSSRPGWAIAGIILGLLALLVAFLFILIVFVSLI